MLEVLGVRIQGLEEKIIFRNHSVTKSPNHSIFSGAKLWKKFHNSMIKRIKLRILLYFLGILEKINLGYFFLIYQPWLAIKGIIVESP